MTLPRLWVFGDSISAEPNTYGQVYSSKLANRKGWLRTDLAQNGSMVADIYPKLFFAPFVAGDYAIIMIGTNDERVYGADSNKLANYATMLAATGFFLTNNVNRATEWMRSGTWTAVPGTILGVYSQTVGSALSTTFTGTDLSFSYLMNDLDGTFVASVDGVEIGTYNTRPPAPIDTSLGRPSGPALVQMPGAFAPNVQHTFSVQMTGAGTVYLEWLAAGSPRNGVNLILCSIPRMVAGVPGIGYEQYGGSDANVALYNGVIQKTAGILGATFVDTGSAINPYLDLGPDGVHPIAQGHDNFDAVLKLVLG